MAGSADRGAAWFAPRLTAWAREAAGPSAIVRNVVRMPGHSGITYGFELATSELKTEQLVLRVPPSGVRRSYSTDVLRLVPLLRHLASLGISVPRVRWHGEDERFFGVPYLIVERVAGTPLPDIFAVHDPAVLPAPELAGTCFDQAVDTLAAIHAAPAGPLRGSGWTRPMSQAEDIDLWLRLLEKSEDDLVIREGHELRRKLLRSMPARAPETIVHGDFYSNNWLFRDGRLTAVLDWENSTLATPMWDLGWLTAMYDPACWGPARAQSLTWAPPPGTLLERYERASDRALAAAGWYEALMCYRIACMTSLNLRLHRTGRRVDPAWEVFGEALPYLFQRARELLVSGFR
jgi:aminoglycoside phosphotransferase (APT) family kinase protein